MKDMETIYQQMREAFAEAAGFVPSAGCDSAVRLYALSAQVASLLAQAEWVMEQCFPQTARGEYLDRHAFARALSRRGAVKAEGVLRFGGAGESVIAAGTVCMSADGRRFETVEEALLGADEPWVDVPARAVEAGEAGNVIAGTVTLMSAMPAGITGCTNPEAFSGGAEAEDDESLRGRILDSYRRLPNGANAAYYEQEALAAGAAAAKAVGRGRGIGTVDVYVTSQEGAPTEELLAAVRERLADKREIAVDVEVLAPRAVTVDVQAELLAAEGETFDEVAARVEETLRGYFDGALLGRGIKTVELAALLYAVEGVENLHLSVPGKDVVTEVTGLPLLGSVSLTNMAEAQ